MTNEEYWAKRSAEREARWFERSQKEIERELARYYASSLRQIQKNIDALYGRYAKDNALDMKTAQKLIRGQEFSQWRYSMKEYLKKAEVGDKKVLLELNTLAMKSRISRLEQLQGETMVELAKLADKSDKAMTAFLKKLYEDSYYGNIFDVAKRVPTSSAFAHVDTKHLEDVLRTPWSGANYSERIWNNTEKLAQVVKETVVQGVHRGESVHKMAKAVAKKMNAGMAQSITLVQTEESYIENRAALDGISEAGFKSFGFLATLDSRTSEKCREHDGKVYSIEEAVQGENVPPLHPRCRSIIVASMRGHTLKGKRIARGEDDQPMYVPADMNYEDWKAVYVEKKQTIEKWEEARMAAPLMLGGVNVAVKSNMKRTFSLGKEGEETEYRSAVGYTTPDLYNFVYPKEYDHSLQRIEPETAIKVWNELPEFIRKNAQRVIEFVDYENPTDEYWRKKYKTKGKTFSASGKLKITFFKNDTLIAGERHIKKAYCHEVGHTVDRRNGKNGMNFSMSDEWTNAMKADKIVSGRNGPTRYSNKHEREDFADSVYAYAIFPEAFKKKFPNRAKLLKELFGGK